MNCPAIEPSGPVLFKKNLSLCSGFKSLKENYQTLFIILLKPPANQRKI